MNIKNTKGKLNKYILVQIALVTLLLILFQSTFYKYKMNMLMYNSTLIIILCVIFYLEVKIQSKDKRIDELIKSEDELREEIFLASCDELTNLPNKEMFIKSLQKTIDKIIKTNSNEKIAVMFLDLDNFKKINDTLGHNYGDELLKIVAEILKFYVGEGNYISRIGGDEFLIFICCDKDCNNVVNLCENIKGMFIEPLKIGNKYACTSVSIGISIFPQDSTDVNILIKNADIAMYKGKNSGKNSYCFFTNNMRQEMERKSEIEKYLRNALENNELQVYYQPQIHVSGKKLAGFEALLRWNSKELGWISPVEFIPIAEETSLIIPIGEWLIKTVCNQYVEWMKKGYAPFTIAINLSAVQIQNKDFGEKIRRIIKETNIDPKYIEFEIAETMLMESLECSIKLLKEFKELGVKVAIDNFGIGYSSFKHLKGLPINTIKIDKSFIDDIDLNSSDRDITHGIIKLAHKINMEVIAEGVGKEGQVSLLEHMECDKIQGYYFSRPLSLESAESMLESADHFFK
ncbi:Cyclic di-GMP phosphodiesterase Gmr [Clostridium liquoris]|jgi:diguanylate cyclase (GGDEF)-like protein|uniref:Cyclic di-GMP phosphodiesterase Gmr n=1 Tax=Clostridium liquoris TaxID=1289519 RepID=A0A2T0B690_9CLOT|nr:EAL domain-containing protein [Clostridium liquoris]PRR79409.1 Cyclic di-GMP phosphodiesterase Gmr [Clostridium liquoris]